MDIDVRHPAPVSELADQVMVPMRDGVRLATDVYLPDDTSARAAVLVRLPYDKNGRYTFMPTVARWVTARGYAFVVQDVRGKFSSEGETVPYVHEVQDGYDTLDWVSKQRWCDGKVVTFGDSYYGWTQWAAVASGHPALRAIVPRVACSDLGTIRVQTRWDRGIVPLYGASYFARHWTANPDFEWDIDWSVRPLRDVFEAMFEHVKARSVAFDAMLDPSPEWYPFPDGHPFEKREVPVLHTVGWFDNIGPDSMRDYMILRSHGKTLQYLYADAFDHENYLLEDTPIRFEVDHAVNDAALERLMPHYIEPALDFYDVVLNGRDAPPARVRWRAGHGVWREAERWPPPSAAQLRLYLSDAKRALADADGGVLAERHSTTVESVSWGHNSDDLVPSTVANPFAFLHERPDEAQVQARDDVVTFTSPAKEQPIELAGAVNARLVLGAAAPTTQVYAKLSDVAPSGEALMLTRGQSYVFDASAQGLVSVYMGHVAHVLKPGHRLRLQIASSDFPLYLPLFGDGENPWNAQATATIAQTLSTGGAWSSYLELDVLS